MKLKKNFVLFIITIFFYSLSAQEKLGISNSNYAGSNGIFLNPSSSVDSRTFAQLNLIGANAFLMNNEVYLPKFSVWSASKTTIQNPKLSSIRMKKFLYSKLEVNGPSFCVSHKNTGIGFFIRGRAELDIRNVPYDLSKILIQQNIDTLKTKYDINIRNAKISEMAWVEYGINFGKMTRKRADLLITVGANVKYLTGINIEYFNLERIKAHVDTSYLDIENLKGKVRYNTPVWKAGKGLGTDIGFTYKKMVDWVDSYYPNSKKSNCTYIDYRYKLGISLLDLGAIRFKNNTVKGDISGSTTINNYTTANLDSIFVKDFQTSEQINKPIWASLPTALSMQADWNLSYYLNLEKDRHIYFNVTAVQGITTARIVGVQRSSLLSIAPRFERKNFEVAIPLTFQRYIYPQLGFAFRFRTFVVGFDNVFPLFLKKDTYGVNAYFNLGISMFKNPACKMKHSKIPTLQKLIDGIPFLAHLQKRAKERESFKLEEKKNKKLDEKPIHPAPVPKKTKGSTTIIKEK